jgi:hypothetical protein
MAGVYSIFVQLHWISSMLLAVGIAVHSLSWTVSVFNHGFTP